MLPAIGSVLGVDVGWSPTAYSSAVCRLDWDADTVTFKVERFRFLEPERSAALNRMCDRAVMAAAFDGPLRTELDEIGVYRTAEKLLTRGFKAIGKPGQASSKNGRELNRAANLYATIIADCGCLARATHEVAIHELSIVEAFPTTFLGVMMDRPEDAQDGKQRSDRYYAYLALSGKLNALVTHLLPGRFVERPFGDYRNHDDRAAIVCALTALCVAAGNYTAVGDGNGWIVLPPAKFVEPWCWPVLERNLAGNAAALFKSM